MSVAAAEIEAVARRTPRLFAMLLHDIGKAFCLNRLGRIFVYPQTAFQRSVTRIYFHSYHRRSFIILVYAYNTS